MRGLLVVGLVTVLGCSKSDPPNYDFAQDKPKPSAPPATKVQATSRWLWITGSGGTFVAFYYVDRTAGPSAKGGRVSDPPTEAELKAAIEAPAITFRDPVKDARAVTEAERTAMKLPARPGWLDIFEPAGSTPPEAPVVEGEGRPPVKAAPGELLQLQIACGKGAGGTWMLGPSSALAIGSSPINGARDRGRIEGDDVLPTHMTFRNEANGASLEPAPGAKVQLNGKDLTSKAPIAPGDRIGVAGRILIVRPADWMSATVGPDPSCPGYAERVEIQDACAMYGSSYMELIGGDSMTVGTDTPSRTGLPRDHGTKAPVRVKLTNTGGKVTFDAEDPKRPAMVSGKPATHGVLDVGQQITTGDRVFGICSGEFGKTCVQDTPLRSCPEHAAKQKPAPAGSGR